MEDCGAIITEEDIRILTGMANGTLKYLTLFPRALGNAPMFLQGTEEHYITPDAVKAILVCRETHPHLTIFLKSEYADAETCPVGMPAIQTSGAAVSEDRNAEGKGDYNRLVLLGHIAAFRMYDDIQLLPLSYFKES